MTINHLSTPTLLSYSLYNKITISMKYISPHSIMYRIMQLLFDILSILNSQKTTTYSKKYTELCGKSINNNMVETIITIHVHYTRIEFIKFLIVILSNKINNNRYILITRPLVTDSQWIKIIV